VNVLESTAVIVLIPKVIADVELDVKTEIWSAR
jgi:hypothetical protein